MITRDEIESKAIEFDINCVNVERDYVFGWVLCGIYNVSLLKDILILKGTWVFVDGEAHTHKEGEEHDHHHHTKPATVVRESPKVGRNDPCPCGSGKNLRSVVEVGSREVLLARLMPIRL